MEEQTLQGYEPNIWRLSRFYYRLFLSKDRNSDVDIEDFEQAGRIAVLNITRKRPEKLNNQAYVNAAIKYSIFGKMKKMRHKVRQVYLAREHDEIVHVVDVLPTKDKSNEKLSELEELLYKEHIGYSYSTIAKYWKENGSETIGSTALLSDEVSAIVSSFDRFQGIPNRAARALGYDTITIKRYWEANGLEPKGKRGKKRIITPSQVTKIILSYVEFDGHNTAAARALGYDPATVKRYWHKAGLIKD